MKNKNTLVSDFTEGNILSQLVKFASPLFLSSLLQVVYNMVDMIVVGNFHGEAGLSAVSVGGDVSNFITFLAMGFCNAGQVIIAGYIGEGAKEKVGRFIGTMLAFLFVIAMILSSVCFFLRVPALNIMNTPVESYKEALNYSSVCILGMVFIYGYNAVSAVLRGVGDSKHPFVFISIAAILNVVLDILFVPELGAGGAALATVISQCISFILCLVFLFKKRENLGFELKYGYFLRIERVQLKKLILLGVPMAIKSASIHFSKMFVNSWINSYGVMVSAFAGIGNKINSISNLFSNSLNTAGSTMVGQNIGARKYDRVIKIAMAIFAITSLIAVSLSLLLVFFPEKIFGIFTEEKAVLEISKAYIPIAVLVFFGSACRAPSNAIINGSGNYKVNFVTAILDGIVLRIGLSLLFGIVFEMKYFGFWLGDALAGFTPMVIGIVFYLSGRWKVRE